MSQDALLEIMNIHMLNYRIINRKFVYYACDTVFHSVCNKLIYRYHLYKYVFVLAQCENNANKYTKHSINIRDKRRILPVVNKCS